MKKSILREFEYKKTPRETSKSLKQTLMMVDDHVALTLTGMDIRLWRACDYLDRAIHFNGNIMKTNVRFWNDDG